MTKTIKQSLIAVLMLLLAVCAVFSTIGVKSSFADESANVTAFNAYMEKFNSYTESDFSAANLASTKEAILGNSELTGSFTEARVLYNDKMTAEEKTAVASAKAVYDNVMKVFSDSIKVSSYNNADLQKALYGTGVKYSMKKDFDEIFGIYNAMTGNEKTYTQTSMKPVEYFGDVKAAIEEIEAQAALAVTAIGNIEYLVGADMKAKSAFADGETGAIVYDSKTTMDAALAALDKIYKTSGGAYVKYAEWDETEKTALKEIITNIEDYDKAVVAWAALQAQADVVANEINALYTGAYTAEGSYKNKTAINTASANYEGLNTTHNDLRNLVSETAKTNLTTMKNKLAAQEANIDTANGKIAALIAESTVDSANGVYTAACKEKIDDVTNYIVSANFEQYILDNKATIFTDYAEYVKINDKYNAMAAAIETLKDKLMAIKNNASNVFADFEEAKAIYTAFVPNQVTDFENEAIDPSITYSYTSYDGIEMNLPCATYKALYVAVRGHADDVASAAQKIIAKINALDLTKYDLEHYTAASAVDAEYKAAPEAVQKVVSNYDKLKNYLDTFANILEGAKTWAAMEIPEVVTYADCVEGGKVALKIAAWNSLESLLKDYVAATTEVEYKNAYIKFMNAQEASKLIMAAVNAAKTAVSAVETVSDPFNLAVGAATTEFVAHVNAATAALGALKGEKNATAEGAAFVGTSIKYNAGDAIAAVFSNDTATEKAKYDNYLKAVAKLPSFAIEAAIDELFTGTSYAEAVAAITLASDKDVTDAEGKVVKYGIASLLAKVAETQVRSYYYSNADVAKIISGELAVYGKLDAALAALTALKAEYDEFIKDVKKMAESKTVAEKIIKINLADLVAFNTKYTNFVGTPEDAYVVEYLKVAKEILDTLAARNAELVREFVENINTVIEKDAAGKIAEVKQTIIDVQNVYNNFTESQRAQNTAELKDPSVPDVFKTVEEKYAEFEGISKKFQYSEYFKDAVDNLEANFNAEGKLTHEAYIQIKTLLAMYNIAPSDIQALLAEPYGKLTEIVKKYDAEDAVFTDINKVAGDLETAKTELEGQIETINGLIEALEDAYKTADTTMNGKIDANSAAIANAVNSLTAAKNDLQGKIDTINATLTTLDTAYKAADAELASKINEIVKEGGTLDTIVADIASAYEEADEALEDAYKAADTAIENAYKAADSAIKETMEEYKTALEAAIAAEKAAREAAVKAETEAREAAVKAETEAREAETKKLHNAIVTISIIFSIVLVALVACVVVLFLKKRA